MEDLRDLAEAQTRVAGEREACSLPEVGGAVFDLRLVFNSESCSLQKERIFIERMTSDR